MMRYGFLSFFLIGVLIPCMMHAKCQQKKIDSARSNFLINSKVNLFKAIKKKQKELKGFQFIQGGTFSTVKPDKGIDRRPENDTSLIIDLERGKRITVLSFFMSEKEVTNLEYRTFVNWVIDSIALTILAAKDPEFYIDQDKKTLNWSRRLEARDTSQFKNLYPLYIVDSFSGSKNSEHQKYILNTSAIQFSFFHNNATTPTIIDVYPDTLCWIRDFYFSYNESMTKKYFQHPSFNNYPVVGVSWIQANAYCSWLSKDGKYQYRLPTQAEFLYCYISIPNSKNNDLKFRQYGLDTSNVFRSFRSKSDTSNVTVFKRSVPKKFTVDFKDYTYPWSSINDGLFDKKGKLLAKFGSYKFSDEYGINYGQILNIRNGLYPESCGSFPASPKGLYDQAGNVAEWVADGFIKDLIFEDEFNKSPKIDFSLLKPIPINLDSIILSLIKSRSYYIRPSIYKRDSLQDLWIKLGKPVMIPAPKDIQDTDESRLYDILKDANNLFSNYQILNKLENPKMVMGGSWNDSPSLMRFGEKRAFSAEEAHSFIGFRVAANVNYGRF
jgi:formylglycine-generating enzyme required for sulfatase activity